MEIQMCDIHMHVIPGVDDGATDMDMALVLLLQAYDQGVRRIFATPHSSAFLDDAAETVKRFESLKTRAKRYFPDLELYPGCEVHCSPHNMDTVLAGLREGRIPSMNGTRYVLTEFSPFVEPDSAAACAASLVREGWIPVIAHVERYEKLWRQRRSLEDLRLMGCLFQINAYSLFDEEDGEIKDCARWLAAVGMVEFLGSDAHRSWFRPPSVKMGLDYLAQTHGRAYAERLAWENPAELLIGREK